MISDSLIKSGFLISAVRVTWEAESSNWNYTTHLTFFYSLHHFQKESDSWKPGVESQDVGQCSTHSGKGYLNRERECRTSPETKDIPTFFKTFLSFFSFPFFLFFLEGRRSQDFSFSLAFFLSFFDLFEWKSDPRRIPKPRTRRNSSAGLLFFTFFSFLS